MKNNFKSLMEKLSSGNKLSKSGFTKVDKDWYIHPSYEGFKFKIDERNNIGIKDPKGGWDTVQTINQLHNILKNFKKK